jgi:hypothetical protein
MGCEEFLAWMEQAGTSLQEAVRRRPHCFEAEAADEASSSEGGGSSGALDPAGSSTQCSDDEEWSQGA